MYACLEVCLPFTEDQEDWLDKKFLEFFPHVFLSHSTELFLKYTRFAKNQPLSLPEHLIFYNKGIAEMEFDVPEMLGDASFLRLINRNYLAVLQIEARRRTFDVYEFLIRQDFEVQIRAEERDFLHQFSVVCPGRTYTEDVPDLFIKMIARAIDEFDPIMGAYQINFAGILLHKPSSTQKAKPSSIRKAYQNFAHKVYSLRRFGIWRETTEPGYISPPDYETLNKDLFKYLEQEIPFYRDILCHNNKYFSTEKTSNPEIYYEEHNKGILRVAFSDMVSNELETKYYNNIYIPADPDDLIGKIRSKSNKKSLFKQNKKADLPTFDGGDGTTIRKIFNEISMHLSSPFLSKKTKAILESVNAPSGKGNPHDQIWALYEELLCNPDNQSFLNMPEIQNILTKSVRRKLSSLYWKQYISSMDAPLSFDSKGNEITLHGSQDKSVFDDDGKISIDDKVINKKTLEDILTYIKTQFTDRSDAKFIKLLMIDVKTQIKRMRSLKLSDNERILTNELTDYFIKGHNNKNSNLDQYIELKSPIGMPCPTEKEFREIKKEFTKKIKNVSHYIQEKLKE